MKTSRYISVLAAVCALGFASSCDIMDFDSENTKYGHGDAVVGFASDNYTFKESAGMVRIPLQITGSPKEFPFTFDIKCDNYVPANEGEVIGDVVLFTQTEGFQFNGAVADGATSPANVYIEFKITDDVVINENRSFTISLENVKGAELSEITTTTVTIKDNDNNPYEKLWGEFTFNGTNISSGAAETFDISINGGWSIEEEDANDDNKLVVWGFYYKMDATSAGYDPGHFGQWFIDYDGENETLAIEVGNKVIDYGLLGFNGLGASEYAIFSASLDMTNPNADFSERVKIPGTWSKDFNTITFEPTLALCGLIYGDGAWTEYYWKGWSNIVLTRK